MEPTRKSLAEIAAHLRREPESVIALARASAEGRDRFSACNAYIAWDGERMQKQAGLISSLLESGRDCGPLMGIPVSVKDLYGLPGLPVLAGTDRPFPPDYEIAGPLVSRVLSQLALVPGKTHTVEFAFGGLGLNAHHPQPINPWSAPGEPRVPGGSSSGAGISVLEGSALLALGTDTAGSVRVPASFCGVAGLKPTAGRWEAEGIIPLSSTLDSPGILAASVADLAYGFAALDPRVHDAPAAAQICQLRIGVVENFFHDDCSDAISRGFQATLSAAEAAGARLVPLRLPYCEDAYEIFRQGGLAAPELRAWIELHDRSRLERLDPVVRARVEGADHIPAHEYIRRKNALVQFGQSACSAFAQCDVIATPTVAIGAPKLSELQTPEGYARANMLALRNTVIANLFGWSALTMPAGFDDEGLPIGLQLMAPPFAEERLLSAGQALEDLAHLREANRARILIAN